MREQLRQLMRMENAAIDQDFAEAAAIGALRDERVDAPAQDEEFVISHSDNVEATGFVEHLKLPHYVDFQAELGLVRRLQREFHDRAASDREVLETSAAAVTRAAVDSRVSAVVA